MAPPRAIRAVRAVVEGVLRRFGPGPVFQTRDLPWVADVERHTEAMQRELAGVLAHVDRIVPFADVLPGQRALTQGDLWRSFFLVAVGRPVPSHAAACPATMTALGHVPGLLNAFFSILAPGTHVPVHRGPYAGVLRLHVGLSIPDGDCAIRIDGEVHRWREGHSLVFDDSYPHEVWNHTHERRVVLFVDFERPLPRPLAALNRALLSRMGASRTARAAWDVVDATRIAFHDP